MGGSSPVCNNVEDWPGLGQLQYDVQLAHKQRVGAMERQVGGGAARGTEGRVREGSSGECRGCAADGGQVQVHIGRYIGLTLFGRI